MSDKPIVDELEITPVDSPRTVNRTQRTLPRPTKKTAPPYKEGALVGPLSKMYAALAIGLLPIAPKTATAIMSPRVVTLDDDTEVERTTGEDCAHAWDEWAKTSPAVRRMLYPLINVSGGAKVVAAHLPIVFSVVAESGLLARLINNTPFADMVEQYLYAATGEQNEK